MTIPTEPIGSIPRPASLIAAWADRQAGRVSAGRFKQNRSERPREPRAPPAALTPAWADRQAGRISADRFNQIADEALRDTLRRFEETGSPVVTDGEQT